MPLQTSPVTAQSPIGGELSTPSAATSATAPSPRNGATMRSATRRPHEVLLYYLFVACASVSVLTTFGIIYVLISQSLPFFSAVPISQFLFGREWAPQINQSYGVLPLLCGTFLVTAGAAIFALPLGLMAAIYLSEYASPKARSTLKPVLELLAGVPSIVYGYFALIYITPVIQKAMIALTPTIQKVFPGANTNVSVFNALSASVAVAIMTLPLVSSLCEDALHVVPKALREGAYALGATKMEVSLQVVVPAALSGIGAAFILAISRAVGETMIVTLAAGSSPKLTLNPLESIQTMTAYIAQISMGDVQHGTIGYQTIFAVGVLLFAITAAMNLASIALVKKYRQKYD